MVEALEVIYKRLKSNPLYKDMGEDILVSLAEEEFNKNKKVEVASSDILEEWDIASLFTKKNEVKMGKELLRKYLADYNIEGEGDKTLLKQLIYLEVIHNLHLQRQINEAKDSDKGQVNSFLLDSLHKNLDQIMLLKSKLGLTKDSKKHEDNDAFSALEKLGKKFKVWLEENQASRTLSCPHCGKMVLLKIKTDMYDSVKHPFFKDRILCNEHLVKLYLRGIITKEDIALILGFSPDYVDWLIEKGFVKKEAEKLPETLKNGPQASQ